MGEVRWWGVTYVDCEISFEECCAFDWVFPLNKLNYVDFLVPKTYFVHREFSFTLKDDVYLRYQSFADQQELEKEILKRNPYKIDIGAVFTHKAS